MAIAALMHPAVRLCGRPLALHPGWVDIIRAGTPTAYSGGMPAQDTPDAETLGNVAIIPVRGVLTNSPGMMSWLFGGGTTYSQITSDVVAAMNDDAVRAIVLHVDSPGGECGGCAEVGDIIYAAREKKPIVAVIDPMACSAAYWIASAAHVVTVPAGGYTGHVGAIGFHHDITGALEQAGVKVTTIQYGDQKSDGYPTTPINDASRARMQADVDKLGDAFVTAVARNRGMTFDQVRATQAHAFLGSDGVDAGFADAVMSPLDAYATLVADLTNGLLTA